MTATETFSERRTEQRRRVLKGGTLRFNRGYGAIEGVVRNESAKGAMLSLGETAGVPAAFDLYVAGNAEPRHANVRWRTATLVGVEFA